MAAKATKRKAVLEAYAELGEGMRIADYQRRAEEVLGEAVSFKTVWRAVRNLREPGKPRRTMRQVGDRIVRVTLPPREHDLPAEARRLQRRCAVLQELERKHRTGTAQRRLKETQRVLAEVMQLVRVDACTGSAFRLGAHKVRLDNDQIEVLRDAFDAAEGRERR